MTSCTSLLGAFLQSAGIILIFHIPQTSCSHNQVKHISALNKCSTLNIMHAINAVLLTLKVLVTTIDAQWEGMGDVGSARYEPALLPPCQTIRVLSYSN